jgi:hypothetical protein
MSLQLWASADLDVLPRASHRPYPDQSYFSSVGQSGPILGRPNRLRHGEGVPVESVNSGAPVILSCARVYGCYHEPMAKQPGIVIAEAPKDEKQLACATCARITSHVVLTAVQEEGESPDGDIRFWEKHWTVQCLGCKTVSFCNQTTSTEDVGFDDHGHQILIPTIKLYPSRIVGRKKLEWSGEVPYPIYRVYDEVHAALCNNFNVLAGIGIRAIVETICKHEGLTEGDLKGKIDGLAKTGVITKAGADILHSLRFMGNVAAHEVKAHTTEELGTAMDVIEHLLLGAYILPVRAKKLPKQGGMPAESMPEIDLD